MSVRCQGEWSEGANAIYFRILFFYFFICILVSTYPSAYVSVFMYTYKMSIYSTARSLCLARCFRLGILIQTYQCSVPPKHCIGKTPFFDSPYALMLSSSPLDLSVSSFTWDNRNPSPLIESAYDCHAKMLAETSRHTGTYLNVDLGVVAELAGCNWTMYYCKCNPCLVMLEVPRYYVFVNYPQYVLRYYYMVICN